MAKVANWFSQPSQGLIWRLWTSKQTDQETPVTPQISEEIANEVFPLERAVTPFSEYKLRLGIAAWGTKHLQ